MALASRPVAHPESLVGPVPCGPDDAHEGTTRTGAASGLQVVLREAGASIDQRRRQPVGRPNDQGEDLPLNACASLAMTCTDGRRPGHCGLCGRGAPPRDGRRRCFRSRSRRLKKGSIRPARPHVRDERGHQKGVRCQAEREQAGCQALTHGGAPVAGRRLLRLRDLLRLAHGQRLADTPVPGEGARRVELCGVGQ